MGLDMYLHRKSYVKRWEFQKPEAQHRVTVTKGGKPHPFIDSDRIAYVVEEVAYWRKANAIHRWFVQHVQGGTDDCSEYEVTPEQLAALVAACKEVLDSTEAVPGPVKNGDTLMPDGEWKPNMEQGTVVSKPDVAARVLPTQSGFFFGGTDYDQYYLEDLKSTVAQLEPLIPQEDDRLSVEFVYRSSW